MALYTAEEGAQTQAPAVANPAPLGLSAFALTTFVLSASNAGFIFNQGTGTAIVVGLALFYGGLVQLVAGIQEFRQGNTFGATAFCSYGGFWLAFGFANLPGTGIVAALVASRSVFEALTVFALGWTIFTGLMLLATFRISGALVGVFLLLFVTFGLLTIGYAVFANGNNGTTWIQIGGWVGIATAVVAWYAALAGVLASVKLANLPTVPMTRS